MSALELNRLPARIAAKITVTPEGCWLWTGYVMPNGYGQVGWEGKMRLTHRVVYTLLVGPIPDGLVLDHVKERGCSNKACCWPDHLEPVTQRENLERGEHSNQNTAKTHCDRGTGCRRRVRARTCRRENERARYVPRPTPHRKCRACDRERKALRRP